MLTGPSKSKRKPSPELQLGHAMNKDIQAELLDLKRRDDDIRTRLVVSGLLYQGYNKDMEIRSDSIL